MCKVLFTLQTFEVACEGSLEGKLSLLNLQRWNLHQHFSMPFSPNCKWVGCGVLPSLLVLKSFIWCWSQSAFHTDYFLLALPGHGKISGERSSKWETAAGGDSPGSCGSHAERSPSHCPGELPGCPAGWPTTCEFLPYTYFSSSVALGRMAGGNVLVRRLPVTWRNWELVPRRASLL